MARFSSKAPLIQSEGFSWYCGLLFGFMLLMSYHCELSQGKPAAAAAWRHRMNKDRPCDEIYVVEEGETLHTISDKCGDPFIVEENPHFQDPDDVYPGLVVKITPFTAKQLIHWSHPRTYLV